MKTKCKDCGVEISEHATHTGREQWCEDCFDKGLHKDMNDHFKNFVEEEMEPCKECNGETIQFRGTGLNLQFRICTKVGTEGHLTMQQAQEKLADRRFAHMPRSGRFA